MDEQQERATDQPQVEEAQSLSLPGRISEGMPVYDSADQVVGTVQLVYYGGASDAAVERALRPREPVSAGADAGDSDWGAFGSDDVPPELRARMLRQGYIRIEGPGIAGVSCYVLPEQISGAFADGVQLYASRHELIGAAGDTAAGATIP